MLNQIAYKFPHHSGANRFLNELRHWSKHDVKAKLHRQSSSVLVSYEINLGGFDYTCSDLDELAARYQGSECGL